MKELESESNSGPGIEKRDEQGSLLSSVVDELCRTGLKDVAAPSSMEEGDPLPNRESVMDLVNLMRSILFPGYFGLTDVTPDNVRFHLGSILDKAVKLLNDQVQRGMCFGCPDKGPTCRLDCETNTSEIVASFVKEIPNLRKMLEKDVSATYEGDPAASSKEEVVFCYPGIRALISHRIAHELLLLGVPLIPRMISEFSHSRTGIDIHPGAEIGERLCIDHGTGVVVGESCQIGNRVRIYQGVTLGAKSFPLDGNGNPIKGIERHPIVEDDVIIYSGATILGRVAIGKGSVIGGNVWLTRSVPPGSRVTQQQASEEKFIAGSGI